VSSDQRSSVDETMRTADGAVQPSRSARAWVPVVAPALVVVAVFVVWQLVVMITGVNPTFLPSPAGVLARLGHDVAAGGFLIDVGSTLLLAALGCVVGLGVALPLGYAIASWRLVGTALTPLIAASQAIPAVAIAPLLALWAGYGLASKVTLCALMVFFPMLLNTVLGLRQVDQRVLEAAYLDGAHGWSLLAFIQAPLARKAVLTGLRGGFTLSITGAVVGEFVIGGTRGLGRLVTVAANMGDTTGLFATVLALCVLAVAVYSAMIGLESITDPTTDRSTR